jgi:hypothetical protein
MGEAGAYLSIKLDLGEPVEIGDFAALFSGMGGQFEDYLRDHHPEAAGSVRMYVREVRRGSVVADLFAKLPDMIGLMDNALIITGFAALFNRRIRTWISGASVEGAKKANLRHAADTIRAVANANQGKAILTSYRHEKGLWKETVEAEFTVAEARAAEAAIEAQKRELDKAEGADHTRVLMTFKRSDIGSADVGVRSGERVIIDAISDRDRALIYGAPLAEQIIKDQMRNTDENIYHKGFVVDVNVQKKNGRIAAYAVTHVHQIIDID